MIESIGKAGLFIRRIDRIARRIFTSKLKERNIENLNPTQFSIISSLLEKDLIPIYEIGKELSVRKSTLTSVLDTLEASGKIERVHSKEDRRNVLIKLKNSNSIDIEAFKHIIAQMDDIFYTGFSQSDKNSCERYLSMILKNLINFEKENRE